MVGQCGSTTFDIKQGFTRKLPIFETQLPLYTPGHILMTLALSLSLYLSLSPLSLSFSLLPFLSLFSNGDSSRMQNFQGASDSQSMFLTNLHGYLHGQIPFFAESPADFV